MTTLLSPTPSAQPFNWLESFFQSSADAIIGRDLSGVVILWNAAAEKLLHLTAVEAMGKPLDGLIPPNLLPGDQPGPYHTRLADQVVTVRSAPLRDGASREVGRAWMLQPSTEREDSEERLRLCVEQSPVSTLMLDRDMNHLVVSKRWMESYLPGEASSVGRNHYEVYPDLPERWKAAHRRCLAGASERGESEYVGKNGRRFYERGEIQPWFNRDGSVGGIVIYSEDITAKKLAEEERERLIRLIEQSSDLITTASLDGQLTFMNAAGRKLIGIDPETDISSIRFTHYIAPEWQDVFLNEVLPTVQEKGLWEGEMQVVNLKTGARIDVFRTTFTVPDQTGQMKFFATVTRDITERKRAEVALKKSEASLAAAQALGHMGSWELDMKTGIASWSAEMTNLHYCTPGDPAPPFEAFLALMHPDDRADFVSSHAQTMRTAAASTVREYRTNPERGPVRNLRATVKVDRNAAGEAVRLVGTTQDITLQKQSEARIRRLTDSNAQGVYFWKSDGEIYQANDAFLKMLGYTREEMAAGEMNLRWISAPEYHEQDRRLRKDLVEKGFCGPVEKDYVHKDGRRIPVLMGADIFTDGLGENQKLEGVCFALDLTDRKKLEQQLLRSQRMESVGTLAGGIAHDLNNILTPILLAISMLRVTVTHEDDRDILTTIEKSAQRGADIVRQVLSFARGVPGVRVEVKVDPILKELAALTKDTFPKNIRQSFYLVPELWSFYGDPTQIHQLLLNLCVNARDAMPSGGQLTISLENCLLSETELPEATPPVHPGRYVLLEVTDTGTGMSAEIIDKIFEPFFTTKPLNKGTGLGLSTVMAIVKTHQASIQVTSRPGQGSTFQIYLPAVSDVIPQEHGLEPELTLIHGRGRTVLVVDDEPAILSIIKRILNLNGYSVLIAANGSEALTLYQEFSGSISLIITDSMMPVLDGHTFIETIRIVNPAVKIVVMSGLTNEESSGPFLRKPFTAESLLEVLKNALWTAQ